MKTKILLFALDYDGCFGFSTTDEIKIKNTAFFDFAKKKIERSFSDGAEFCKIILIIGSNRQTPENDSYNSSRNGNGSCAFLLPAIQDGLNELLKKELDSKKVSVEISPFMMPDLYHKKPPGTTFSLIQKVVKEAARVEDLPTIFDKNKITLLYTITHHTLNTVSIPDSTFSMDCCFLMIWSAPF